MSKETTMNTDRLALLSALPVKHGSHTAPAPEGKFEACAMELVAWLADEPWSDSPACACPVISAFVRRFNDGIRDDVRRTELLRPLLPRLIGSRSTPEVEQKRAYLAADWAVRVVAPRYLELRPKTKTHAEMLRGLAPIVDRETAIAARDVAREARDAAYAAYADAAAYAAAYAAYAAAAYAAAYAAYAADAAAADAAAYAAYAAYADAARRVATELQPEAVALIERMLECK